MKMKSVIIAVLAILVFSPTVYASYWSLSLTGSYEATAGEELAIELIFTATETYYVDGWDLEFSFDTSELQAVWDDSVPEILQDWKIEFNSSVADALYFTADNSTGYYRAAAGNLSSYFLMEAGDSVTFATLYFTVSDLEEWDGLADLVLLAQEGDFGLSDLTITTILNFDGADGADVGVAATSAVPVPAAVWLLGSGLVGLAGIRRRFR